MDEMGKKREIGEKSGILTHFDGGDIEACLEPQIDLVLWGLGPTIWLRASPCMRGTQIEATLGALARFPGSCGASHYLAPNLDF